MTSRRRILAARIDRQSPEPRSTQESGVTSWGLALFLVAALACATPPPVLHRVVVVKPEGSDSSGVLDRCREFCSHNFQTWRKHRGPVCESAVVKPDGDEEFLCRAGDASNDARDKALRELQDEMDAVVARMHADLERRTHEAP